MRLLTPKEFEEQKEHDMYFVRRLNSHSHTHSKPTNAVNVSGTSYAHYCDQSTQHDTQVAHNQVFFGLYELQWTYNSRI